MSKIVYSDFSGEDPHWNLMCLGHGYLDVAEFSAREFPKRWIDQTQLPHALPIIFSLFQGLENFFKGALGHITGSYPPNHCLEDLMNGYNRAVDDLFQVETRTIQWIFDLERRAATMAKNSKDPGSQGYRYLIDKKNNFIWPDLLVEFGKIVLSTSDMVYLTRIIHGRLFVRKCDKDGVRYVDKPWWMTDEFYQVAIVPRFPIAGQES